jgi:hypothetical protein
MTYVTVKTGSGNDMTSSLSENQTKIDDICQDFRAQNISQSWAQMTRLEMPRENEPATCVTVYEVT